MRLDELLKGLLSYALKQGILDPVDKEYAINQLLYLFKKDALEAHCQEVEGDVFLLLEELLDLAVAQGLIEENSLQLRDHFEAKLFDCLMPRPSEVDRRFRELYKQGPKVATDWFYRLSKATNYIKTRRIDTNIHYQYLNSSYAPLDITINLSKPEKDPKLIAMMAGKEVPDYPSCALCMENVGFYGTFDKASRSNHRVVSIDLLRDKGTWGFQYSPYSYFNEHCIVLKKAHVPMNVDKTTFAELVDFVNRFPHYLIGSNAGLPIVGGSILNHYHFQGGRHVFPIERAAVLHRFKKKGVDIELLDWPLSTIRLTAKNEDLLLDMAGDLLDAWTRYSNPPLSLFAQTDKPHNAVTPIVKLDGSSYVMYFVLRNNYAPPNRPYGLFHPRDEYFHIKKENIGLIEVMGLAVLPGRLKAELEQTREVLMGDKSLSACPELAKHAPWIRSFEQIPTNQEDIDAYLQDQVGKVFEQVLEDCGVFKRDQFAAFREFVEKAVL
jgi:UDPglucose--hexose-1-phosphate uridylyltransferase